MNSQAEEVFSNVRYEFGRNWTRFLSVLDDERVGMAVKSLEQMLEVEGLAGRTFLDIGSGSGLFSLAAKLLGARVHSFDFDPQSVACTAELKRRYFPIDADWTVEQGSVLDEAYVRSLGKFDIVYSWGVLHHTGNMRQAMENAQLPVAPEGKLFIAIYNDMGRQSARWKRIKRTYNELPGILRPVFAFAVVMPTEAKSALRAALTLRFADYIRSWTQYKRNRGMSHWHDIVDWVGGYPYEVAKPEEILDFYRPRGFNLVKLRCGGGLGCNEFVFVKQPGGVEGSRGRSCEKIPST